MRRGGALGIVGASHSKVWHSLASRIRNTSGQGCMLNTGNPYGGCTKGHTFPVISGSTEFLKVRHS